MEFELYSFLRNSITYFELIAAIFGTIYYYKYKKTFMRFFLVILWYTILNEFLSYILRTYNIEYLKAFDINFNGNIYTALLYNIYHLINFSFLILLYGHYIQNITLKKIIYICGGAYVVSFFVNMLFQDYISEVQTVPFIIAAITIIACILMYFYQILNSNEVLHVSKNLLFYISIGYLLYLVGILPMRIVRNYFYELPNYQYIYNVGSILSITMNMCFIAGFIWSEKKQQ